jgi:predicted nuclease of predicted toxin-antitoxin system
VKFLLDQNFDHRLIGPLRANGHDVTIVAVDYPPGMPDRDVLVIAHREGRVVLTNDRDFGELAVREKLPHAGIIYLRLRRTTAAAKWERLNEVLREHAGHAGFFLTVTESSVRVR